MDGQGNLERTWKVREKSGYLEINGYARQTSEKLLILFKRGKDVLSHEIVQACFPPHWGLVVGRLIELVDHYSFRVIRFDHWYFFLYSINRYKLLHLFVNCFKIDLHISHHTF